MPIVAVSGRARCNVAPFVGPHAAWWWDALREVFPVALAGVVLPSSFEVVAAVDDPTAAFVALVEAATRLSSRLSTRPRLRAGPVLRPIASPRIAADGEVVRCWVQHVLDAPRRAGLVGDALHWRWSTARDLAGGVCDPWVNTFLVRTVLGEASVGDVPVVPRARMVGRGAPLAAIASAAAEATRAEAEWIERVGATRNVFVWLARAEGWSDAAIAEATRLPTGCVRAIASAPNAAWRDAAARCLHDPRLARTGGEPRVA